MMNLMYPHLVKTNGNHAVFIGYFLGVIGASCIGPAFFLPDSTFTIAIGISLLGAIDALALSYLYEPLQHELKQGLGLSYSDKEISRQVSSIGVNGINIGSLAFYSLSGTAYDLVGFKNEAYFVAGLSLACLLFACVRLRT